VVGGLLVLVVVVLTVVEVTSLGDVDGNVISDSLSDFLAAEEARTLLVLQYFGVCIHL